jgi:putative ABC transport system permease protein
MRRFTVASIWRDYARPSGSIVISRQAYIAATGDSSANEGSVWLKSGAGAAATEAALRARFARGDSVEVLTSTALRERGCESLIALLPLPMRSRPSP